MITAAHGDLNPGQSPTGDTRGSSLFAGNPLRAHSHRMIGRLTLENAQVSLPGGKTLLDDISFSVEPGAKLAVIGPNGAGKTSLLRLLSVRQFPLKAASFLTAVRSTFFPPIERARLIAVVSQNNQPDGRLTIRQYIELGRIPHRGLVSAAVHRNAIDRAIALVGLETLAARPLQNVSGGERQRAAIARAIVQEPSLLLLDEPTNHLDPRARADVLNLAAQLGSTVVAILHDLDRITAFADQVAVLASGRLVVHGDTSAALHPDIVRSVFNMDCFRVVNPITGRDHIVFDTPLH